MTGREILKEKSSFRIRGHSAVQFAQSDGRTRKRRSGFRIHDDSAQMSVSGIVFLSECRW